MITLKEAIRQLSTNDRIYSELAEVIQTYRVKDQQELGMTYNSKQHTKCDVRLVKDGSIVYDVLLTPAEVTSGDTVFDGSPESPSGSIQVNVPKVSSKVFITWLDTETAFVSLNTFTESIIVGSSEGAYLDFYTRDESRIIDLVNCDEFTIQFSNGETLSIKVDANTGLGELISTLNSVNLLTEEGSLILDGNIIEIVTKTGKISVRNDSNSLKDILSDIVKAIQDYITSVSPGLSAAGTPLDPSIASGLTQLQTRISNLMF